MYEIGIDSLSQLLEDGRTAAEYAWKHYEELAKRKHSHTLYGPYAYDIGACIPSKMTPKRARKLTPSTRRKDYLIYQLDEEYNVIRTISMMDYSKVDCVYHHFELNGVWYAYPFRGEEKALYKDTTAILKFSDGKPVYFGLASRNLLFAQFYEYVSSEKMIVSTYRYWPTAKFTQYGYPADREAPLGALNSPVDFHCTEEVSEYIDFSHWFQ